MNVCGTLDLKGLLDEAFFTPVNLDNESLKQACGNGKWNDNYNDLIDCGEDYLFGGSGGREQRANVKWGYYFSNGVLTPKTSAYSSVYNSFVKRGVRLILELKKDVQIIDVDGKDGSSEENAYELFLAD